MNELVVSIFTLCTLVPVALASASASGATYHPKSTASPTDNLSVASISNQSDYWETLERLAFTAHLRHPLS